ncbi:MAG: Gfo/Idh/MocA family oxidoreductase [Pirellulaceae bacterium]
MTTPTTNTAQDVPAPGHDPGKKFALIGAAGFVAPRHMQAIRDTGNVMVAALDKSDSVGIIDSYFPDAAFFTEFERFDRHVEKLRRERKQHVDYVSICSPNYLHDAHIRFALRVGADAICEKPLVVNPWNVEPLADLERETGQRICCILQLRLHPTIIALKERIEREGRDTKYDIDLTYITSRGRWYLQSWKGDIEKSGGVTMNIGVHFFDMLRWIFGRPSFSNVNVLDETRAAGYLELDKARVRWFLSLDRHDLPHTPEPGQPSTYRSITVDGEEMEFSSGVTDLHTQSYQKILSGEHFTINDARDAIDVVYGIRTSAPVGLRGEYHPFLVPGNGRAPINA